MTERAYETGQKGAARRAAIVELARRALIDDGYDRFVLREIANRADMKLGNLQYYFSTREDLLDAVIGEETERDLTTLRELSSGIDSPEAALRACCEQLVATWSGESGKIWGVLNFLAMHNVRFRESRARVYARFYAELAAIVGKLRPTADKDARQLATQLITSLVDGAAMQTHVGASANRKRQARLLLNEVTDAAIRIARRA
jgi:AcrR family transcriptional regulator